jgi:hypothetical protein
MFGLEKWACNFVKQGENQKKGASWRGQKTKWEIPDQKFQTSV